MNRGTLTQLFFTTVDRHAGLPAAFRSKVGGAWVSITHREALERVQAISLGLRELGIQPGDKVAIISENRPEWSLTDYACLCARATDVPIYPTLTAKQTQYILRDSESVAAFVSTADQLDKVLEVRGQLPGLKHVVVFDGAAAAQRPGVLSLAAVEAKGRAVVAKHPNWRAEALSVGPEDLATLIYTSGTTGDPKGVMLSH
ncbi:MAG TPA: AMP-binding protein, partial [Gemmatimonadales bacterium]|nr:AMP-binding protein [Gemmatimonadales bacterium]